MKLTFNRIVASFFAVTVSLSVTAEDIELYVNHNVETDENPRVVIIFDTSGSMGSKLPYNGPKKIDAAKDAMTQLVNDNSAIDFGLMRFNYNADNEPGGGYVLARIGANENTLVKKINELPAYGSTPLTETLWEAYLYISGQNLKFAKNVDDRDTSAENSQNYESPFRKNNENSLRCDNSINIILMTDGEPQNDDEADNSIKSTYNNVFKSNAGSFGSYSSYLVALAKILHGNDNTDVDLYPQTTETIDTARLFTIGFGGGMDEDALELLEEAAKVGGGDYFEADTAATLTSALKNTITLIREENSTFTSPSFASNNVDQTRSKDAVYLAMFYPEVGTRWRGNLKKIKVGLFTKFKNNNNDYNLII